MAQMFKWKKRVPLKKGDAFKAKSLLLQQIEHGDYDISQYRQLALSQLEMCKKEQKQLTKTWIGQPESLKVKLEDVERRYIKQYNAAMENHHKEEIKILAKLRSKLTQEFKLDLWDEVIFLDGKQDLVGLYNNYKKLANDYKEAERKKLELEENRELPL